MDWSLRNAFSRPLFGLKPGSFGTFMIWRRVDNSPVTPTKKKKEKKPRRGWLMCQQPKMMGHPIGR